MTTSGSARARLLGMILILACAVLTLSRGCGAAPGSAPPESHPPPSGEVEMRKTRRRFTPAPEGAPSPAPAATAQPAVPDVAPGLDALLEPAVYPAEPARERLGRLAKRIPVRVVVSEQAAGTLRAIRSLPARILTAETTGRNVLNSLMTELHVTYTLDHGLVRVHLQAEDASSVASWEEVQSPEEAAPLGIFGEVTDADGIAVAGAVIVQVLDQDFVRGTSDAAGRFNLQLGEPFGSLEARVPGRATSPAIPVKGVPGGVVTVLLRMGGAAGSLVIRVKSADQPIGQAVVLLGGRLPGLPAEGSRRQISKRTDADGAVSFEGLAPGDVAVQAYAHGYRPEARTVHVEEGAGQEVILVLSPHQGLAEEVRRSRVTISLVDASPRSAVDALSQLSHIPIVMSPAVAEASAQRTFSLSEADSGLDQALQTLCGLLGDCTYEIDEASHAVVLKRRVR